MKKLMVLNLVALAAFVAFGATRRWTGGGDGLKWSDPQNWDVGNANLIWSDEVVFDSGSSGDPLVTSNDLGTAESPIDVGKIVCTGSGTVILKGNLLNLRGISYIVFTNNSPVVSALDVNLPGTDWKQAQWHCAKILEQTGTISMSSSGWICLYTYVDDCVFSGDINCPKGQIRANTKKRLYLDGKLTASAFNDPDGASTTYNGAVYYRHPSNEVAKVGIPMINIVAEAENALGTNAIVVQGWNGINNSRLTLNADQTIDRFGTPSFVAKADNQHIVRATVPSKLTMKATADCISDSQFNNALTLVWDPQGDYNFTAVTNHVHSIEGGIVVKRGTFSVVGTTTKMENMTFVKVADDATFAMDVSSELALRYLATVDLGERARFEYGPSMSRPHVTKYPVFYMADGAKVKIPAGIAITGCVFRAGAYVGVGTYTGSDNAAPGDATPIGWIEGEGTFTTVNDYYNDYWAGGDGFWTDAGKWSSGFPSANREARIWERGNMTLTLTGEVKNPLHVRNFVEGLTELAVGSAVTRTHATTLEGGVRLTVGSGGVLTHNSADVNIRHGAEMRVAGGELNFANYAKTNTVGYVYGKKTTRLSVESGSVSIAGKSGGAFNLDKGGLVEMSGGTMTVTGLPVRMVDATSAIALSGNAKMNLNSLDMCSGSMLSLKVGASAVPRLDVSGTMTVASGSSIAVDATEWVGGGSRLGRKKLVSWGAISGTPNVTIVPAEAAQYLAIESDGIKFGLGGSIVIVF